MALSADLMRSILWVVGSVSAAAAARQVQIEQSSLRTALTVQFSGIRAGAARGMAGKTALLGKVVVLVDGAFGVASAFS